MKETRAGKYGRNLAIMLNYMIDTQPDSETYRSQFIEELKTYSFEPRIKGTPRNSGCVHELENIDAVNLYEPKDLAKLVKEGIHLMYQKNTAKRAFNSLLENLNLLSQ